MGSTAAANRSIPARRGGVYVLVLIVSSVVTGFGLLGLALVKTQHLEGLRIADAMEARHQAGSAMDSAIHLLNADPDWRVSRSSGDWAGSVSMGSGQFAISVEAVGGGAYTSDAGEPVQVTGTGLRGDARSRIRATATLITEESAAHVPLLRDGKVMGYWPLAGSTPADFEKPAVGDYAVKNWSTANITPGAVPGLGSQVAAWFNGTGEAEIDRTAGDYADQIRTVSVWFWAESLTGTQGIVTCDVPGRGEGGRWEFTIESGTLQARFDTEYRTLLLVAPSVTPAQWNHAAFVVSDAGMRLFLNGKLADAWSSVGFAGEVNSCEPDRPIHIGVSMYSGSDRYLTGSVCELAVLAGSLTDDEVLALYEAYAAPASYAFVADSWERVVD